MSGHKSFRELRNELRSKPGFHNLMERRRAVEAAQFATAVQALTAVRETRGVTQAEVAEAWETTQSNVSRFEHSQDTYLSSLMRYAAALGGHLELRVVFPDQVVDLTPRTETPPAAAAYMNDKSYEDMTERVLEELTEETLREHELGEVRFQRRGPAEAKTDG
jgi:transcriptional regulator with XRE-family HTH domain